MSSTQPNQLDQDIAALTTQVAQNVTVEGSAATLINSIPTLIANAVAEATAAGATPVELAAITALGIQLAASAAPLTAAITANTASAGTSASAAAAVAANPSVVKAS